MINSVRAINLVLTEFFFLLPKIFANVIIYSFLGRDLGVGKMILIIEVLIVLFLLYSYPIFSLLFGIIILVTELFCHYPDHFAWRRGSKSEDANLEGVRFITYEQKQAKTVKNCLRKDYDPNDPVLKNLRARVKQYVENNRSFESEELEKLNKKSNNNI